MNTSFKVFFNNEIRRVGIPSDRPTFFQVKQAIHSIFAAQIPSIDCIKIKYIDEDNDYITVCSQIEWNEALAALNSSPVKKIYISIDKSKVPVERKATCIRPTIIRPTIVSTKSVMNKMVEDIANGVKVDYSLLGNKLTRLSYFLRCKSLQLLETKQYTKALNILNAAIELTPHSNIELYNLACAHALLGNAKSACEYLQKSTEFGYKNLTHIMADPDLDSIRGLLEYEEIINGLKAGCPMRFLTTTQSESKPQEREQEQKKDEEEEKKESQIKEEVMSPVPEESPAPEIVKEDAKKDEYETELALLNSMGFCNRDLNKSLLEQEKGNIDIVANILLLL